MGRGTPARTVSVALRHLRSQMTQRRFGPGLSLGHSTARQAHVRVKVDDGAVVIEVVDDGRQRATTFLAGRHGVRGMQERAAALGGTCEAGMANGAGWRVRARIPLSGKGP